MNKYKDTNLKLAKEGDVDVIYFNKEATVSNMNDCKEDTALVSSSSIFCPNLLLFI